MFNSFFGGFAPTEEKVEEKVEQKTEEKREEKREEPVVESFDGYKTFEERNTAFAAYLEELFEKDFSLMFKFVQSNPKLGKYELAEKWIQENL